MINSREKLSEYASDQGGDEKPLGYCHFLPIGEDRQGEGGLRMNGDVKSEDIEKPLITVITIVFNGEEILESTICSIINQSYPNVEFIVVDGGSEDGTLDIIRNHEHAIDYWVSEKDRGIYNAMNKGIELASGQWMIFMNAGDSFYDCEVLESVSCLLDDTDCDIVYGKSLSYYHGYSVVRYEDFSSEDPDFYRKKLPNHQAVFLSRNKFPDLRYDESYQFCADSDYLFKAFGNGKSREYGGFVSLFELGGASNFYPTFKAFITIAFESRRLRGGVKPLLAHTVKYFLQRVMGKEAYMKFYVKSGVKR